MTSFTTIKTKTSPFTFYLALFAAVTIGSGTMAATMAQAQDTTVITTTTTPVTSTHHHFHPGAWLWRHGYANPGGIFTGNNIVTIPAITLAQSVVNNCPTAAPVLLSTGQCITATQALQMIQAGQITIGGTVQTQGTIVIGTPSILGAHGYASPFDFAGHLRHFHHDRTTTTTTAQTSP